MKSFRALLIQNKSDKLKRSVEELPAAFLVDDDVLIKVHYSALNYKDALSANGHRGITKKYPHVPGIDASGVVVKSRCERWKEGDEVVVTSYDLGMNTSGGFGDHIATPEAWPVQLPENMSLRKAMIYGTSGFTAGLALHQMEQMGQTPEMGPILVTGASGAVGTAAVALLHKAGYEVIASTGKTSSHEALKTLGANEIIDRDAVNDKSEKPFLSPKWAGAIDTVGGNTLSTILKASMQNANVAVCGLVASPNFATTVYPFIIKGNNLLGVETATCPRWVREKIWENLAGKWAFELPENLIREVGLEGLLPEIDNMLAGNSFGKVLLKHD